MGIFLFIVILLVLVLVHEFGHFIVAKAFKIRVDEFAFGFPPRLFSKKYGETTYAYNALPIGGYVRIYGENPNEVGDDADASRSFGAQAHWKQALVIVAGVVFNIMLAWVLLSSIFLLGAPMLASNKEGYVVQNPQLTIVGVGAETPAKKAGMEDGDIILSLTEGGATKQVATAEEVQAFISGREGVPIIFELLRGDEKVSLSATPQRGIAEGKPAVGIYMEQVGDVRLGLIDALLQGAKRTYDYTILTAGGIFDFLGSIIVGKSDFSQVTGPVGIVGVVGSAAEHGLVNVLLFTALISINLAIINLLPFPALDGGRLLFVIIESIARRPIPVKFATYTNFVGFALLMLLMLVVTYHDIIKLF